jgi:small-conductance mechanosensitive channel
LKPFVISRKTLAILLSAAVVLPASPVGALAAQVEAARGARVAVPAPVLPASAVSLPRLDAGTVPGYTPAAPLARTLPAQAAPLAPTLSAQAAPLSAAASATDQLAPGHGDNAPAAKAAPAVAAQAQLRAAQKLLAPESGSRASSAGESREKAERVWSGAAKREGESAVDLTAAEPPSSSSSGLSKPSRAPRAAALLGAAAVPAPKAAGAAAGLAGWLLPLWHSAQPYVMGAAVLAGTYAAHRGVRWAVDRLAKRGKWDPNAADTARFVATIATWSLGAAVGLHLAGASTTALITGFGVAMSLAVKKSVGNLLQGVVFLVNRPFMVGEKIRIADTMYQVEDMQLQYVTMRVIGKLAADKPDPVPAGVKLVPMKELDPLGRDKDDKGYKWVLIRETSPGPAPREGVQQMARQKYSNLAGASITIYRPYSRDHHGIIATHLGLIPKVKRPSLPVGQVLSALKETRGSLLRAALWMAVSLAFIPLLPVAKAFLAFKAVAILYPYVHGAAAFWATRQVSKFVDAFVPRLGAKLGWSRQAVIVTKLLAQAGVYFVGMSAAMRALGLEWRSVATSLGATAAAISFASSDMLGNLAQALQLRFDRPFNIGDTLRVGTDVGVVQEMNMFYVVLKVADGSHTLVPYSVIDSSELDTFESSGPDQNPK